MFQFLRLKYIRQIINVYEINMRLPICYVRTRFYKFYTYYKFLLKNMLQLYRGDFKNYKEKTLFSFFPKFSVLG